MNLSLIARLCSGVKSLQGANCLTRVHATIARKMHYQVTMGNESGSAEIPFPGLGFEDMSVDASGQKYRPRIWRLLYLLDFSRERAFNEGYLDVKKLEETHFTYVRCLNLERKLQFQALEPLNIGPYGVPFTVKLSIGNVGKSSFQLDHKIIGDDKELFTSSIVYVCVDNKTRQPDAIPQWWKEKYRKLDASSVPLRIQPLNKDTTNCFTHSMTVGALDLDYYGHANNCAYARFGAETVGTAFRNGGFEDRQWGAGEGEVQAAVKKMEAVFLKDCALGERLEGSLWCGEGNRIYCVVRNEQGEDVYHQSMEIGRED